MRRFVLVTLVAMALTAAVLPVPRSAAAADLQGLVQQLGSDDFDHKADAVSGLATLGDKRAVGILRALDGDALYVTRPAPPEGADDTQSDTTGDGTADAAAGTAPAASQGRVVIVETAGNDCAMSDPVDGSKLDTVPCDRLDKIIINNRLRQVIAAALGKLTLLSDKRSERLAAAREAMKKPVADSVAALTQALAAERDAEIRDVLAGALAATKLTTGSTAEQLAAIKTLAGTGDPQIYSLLRERDADKSVDPEVRRALDTAIAAMAFRLKLVGFVENLFQGLSLGSVLLLAAIGLAITFGVMGVINMAHGEMIMLGAYTTYVVQQVFRTMLPPQWLDAYLVAAVPVAFLVAGAVGIALERTIIRFLYGRPLETLLATWGVSLALQQVVRSIFGAPNKEVANPSWMTGNVQLLGSATITWNHIVILGFCFVVLGALVLLLRRTALGLHMRAVTQNREMAAAMGIATARVDALTFGLGSGIAGMAGVALSQIGNVSPNLGGTYIVDSFLVVVFGGVGNLAGTLVAAMTLGVVNKLLEPLAGAVLGKIVVLLFIILFIQKRPRGLFALKGRAVES